MKRMLFSAGRQMLACGVAAAFLLFSVCSDTGTGPTTGPTTYAVYYDINGGSGITPTVQTVNAGNGVTLNSESGFTMIGYTFGGWNTNSSGTGTNYSSGALFTPTSNITLYARWVALYCNLGDGICISISGTEARVCNASGGTVGNSCDGSDDIEMVFVQGGTFTMGCTSEQGDDCHSSETPISQVTLSDFYIGKYEVTQAQWKAVMGTYTPDTRDSVNTGDNFPVEYFIKEDVLRFIETLNSKTTGRVYRLPTEAEWEYAARGGVSSGGYNYAGSKSINDVAWYIDNIPSQTHGTNGYGSQPVGTKAPNELGIYDMSGNVWEWVSGRAGDYTLDAKTNPTGLPTGGYDHGLRGGSWRSSAVECRVSSRFMISYGGVVSISGVGFRLASSP